MRRAGTVVGVAQGVAVLRSPDETHPEIGEAVVDERLQEMGRIVDVFGPVERPYLAVSPADELDPDRLLGTVLYVRTT